MAHLDVMTLYRQIRKAKGKEPSYSLDYVKKEMIAMSHKDSKVIVNVDSLMMDEDGTLSLYFTDSLAMPEHPNQLAMQTYAELATDPTRVGEASVSIVLDLPAMIKDLLSSDVGYEDDKGLFHIDEKHKPALDNVKAQLIDALILFNRVRYQSSAE